MWCLFCILVQGFLSLPVAEWFPVVVNVRNEGCRFDHLPSPVSPFIVFPVAHCPRLLPSVPPIHFTWAHRRVQSSMLLRPSWVEQADAVISAFQPWMIEKDEVVESVLWDARFFCCPALKPLSEDDGYV